MSGTVGYSLKGVDVEVSNLLAGSSKGVVERARMSQGEREYLDLDEQEKRDVVERWHQRRREQEDGKKDKGKGRAILERMSSQR